MKIRFWGTRGSIARPSKGTLGYGGNTSCVEVRTNDGTLLVLDCGTGAWELGRQLLAEGMGRTHGHLLISHTHWDHIQGFPFFAPLFAPGWTWDVYAPGGLGAELERALGGQMTYEYFPITLEALAASLRYHNLTEGDMQIGENVLVKARYLNHPAVTLGYRIETGGRAVVYSADHEPHAVSRGEHRRWWKPVHVEDRRHVEFLRDADLVIHDTQYTETEYVNRIGWGHTPIERAVDYAMEAGVKTLALYHHDPARTDEELDRLVEQCREKIEEAGSPLKVFAAAEHQSVELEEDGTTDVGAMQARSAQTQHSIIPRLTKIVMIDDDPDMLRLFESALSPDGYRLLCSTEGDRAVETIARERPALVILDYKLPGMNGVEVCREIRRSKDPSLSRIPVVMVTGEVRGESEIAHGFENGVTDYLLKPVKASYLRARVRGWLLRDEGL